MQFNQTNLSRRSFRQSFLKSRGISFQERDVRANPEFRRILTDEIDSCTLPTLVAGDTIIPGFDLGQYQQLAGVFASRRAQR